MKTYILYIVLVLFTVSSASAQKGDTTVLDSIKIEAVSVRGERPGISKVRYDVVNTDNISTKELFRAACCNLGESFVTNPSVDVSYSDAATGAKQIKLLGLSGTYVQMLTENIPSLRGIASPYSLGYIPGAWLQSIQVSKGTSSVKNGYEALSGQINVEFKKSQTQDIFAVNLYANSMQRYEANADVSAHINENLSTLLLAHYENETVMHDRNGDGFTDLPSIEQVNLMNRWAYDKGNYRFQAGIKILNEQRGGGQTKHGGKVSDSDMPRYKIGIGTDRYEAYIKNAYIIDPEKGYNVALILSGSIHNQDASFGKKLYDADQRNLYASLIMERNYGSAHNISAGLSFNHDDFLQHYLLGNTSSTDPSRNFTGESISGAYAQYTLTLDEKLTVMAGIRGDYSSLYGTFFTPRAHIKYDINQYIHLRASVGKGYRSTHILAQNSYLFASSRRILINGADPSTLSAAAQMGQEKAWNYGLSIATYIPISGNTLNLNAEYYFTDFKHQVNADMDSDAHTIDFVTIDAGSFSRSFQIEATYPFFRGFKLTGAYRHTDVKSRSAGMMREKPLVGRYKGLVTASYQTPLSIWQFDVTLGLNGGGRMPLPDGETPLWGNRYGSYEQLSAQITRHFRRGSIYLGGENLTAFSQHNPIIDATNPWGSNFDSSMTWGPIHGAIVYIGVRFNLQRKE